MSNENLITPEYLVSEYDACDPGARLWSKFLAEIGRPEGIRVSDWSLELQLKALQHRGNCHMYWLFEVGVFPFWSMACENIIDVNLNCLKIGVADFSESFIFNTRLRQCQIPRSSFFNSSIRESLFFDCIVTCSEFSDSGVSNTAFEYSVFDRSYFDNCWFSDCKIVSSIFDRSSFVGVNFYEVSVIMSRAPMCEFRDSCFSAVDFNGSNLSYCDFTGCSFNECCFDDCDVTGSDFRRSNLSPDELEDLKSRGAIIY